MPVEGACSPISRIRFYEIPATLSPVPPPFESSPHDTTTPRLNVSPECQDERISRNMG